jgi:phage replication-related protein YjqB (UPF0714/DUF867 family)
LDLREARRAAEKAARDRIAERVRLAGELGVLAQCCVETEHGVEVAQERADALVQAAKESGQRVVDVASTKFDEARSQYENAYAAALSAGWTTSDLEDVGFNRSGLADRQTTISEISQDRI